MKISRRHFIKAGSFAAVFAGTTVFAPVSSKAQEKTFADDSSTIGSSSDPFSNKTPDDFRKYVGAEFLLLSSRGTVSAVLTEVTETTKNIKSGKKSNQSLRVKGTAENFVLAFQMPTYKFSQATYQIWHPDFGQFDLFLVPGKHSEPFLLYAVINRL